MNSRDAADCSKMKVTGLMLVDSSQKSINIAENKGIDSSQEPNHIIGIGTRLGSPLRRGTKHDFSTTLAALFCRPQIIMFRSQTQTDQGCQMAKFDPFLSLDCARARVEGVGAQSKERKGSNFAA